MADQVPVVHAIRQAALWALSEALLVAQLARIKASPCYSILADSSTDVSLEEHLLLYVRFIDPVTFVCVTEFLCAVRCLDKTASGVTTVITKITETLEFDLSRMVGFGSDGASVFFGARTGVIVRLRAAASCYLLGGYAPEASRPQRLFDVEAGVVAVKEEFRLLKAKLSWQAEVCLHRVCAACADGVC